jgi:hypothetical protein
MVTVLSGTKVSPASPHRPPPDPIQARVLGLNILAISNNSDLPGGSLRPYRRRDHPRQDHLVYSRTYPRCVVYRNPASDGSLTQRADSNLVSVEFFNDIYVPKANLPQISTL